MPTVPPKQIVIIGGKKYRAGDEYPGLREGEAKPRPEATKPKPKAKTAPEAKKADTKKGG